MSETRREQLALRLETTRARIASACAEAGRDPAEVTLIVVTKFFPASDVRLLAELGVTDVAENRHQEALEKSADCADLAGAGPTSAGLRWHFVGGLQSNKAAAVTAYADVVHSVDRAKLVGPLARGAAEHAATKGGVLDVLIQVSLDAPGADQRAGVAPADLVALAERVSAAESLQLRGLMAVAPLGEEPAAAFDRLAELRRALLAEHAGATWLSAGMTGDLEAAVIRGATHVRVGSGVLGSRPVVQ